MCCNQRVSNYEIIQKIIKDELKNKLKVNTSIQFPNTFIDGYIKTEVIYDNEVINTTIEKIQRGSTMFSF